MAAAGVDFPLVHASAEAVPYPDASFDTVFCDHGAMTFADPRRTVPEAARLLRSDGLLVFSMHTRCRRHRLAARLRAGDRSPAPQLLRAQRVDVGESQHVEFQLPYGEWIRLFRANGLIVEDLIELRPGADAVSTYRTVERPGMGAALADGAHLAGAQDRTWLAQPQGRVDVPLDARDPTLVVVREHQLLARLARRPELDLDVERRRLATVQQRATPPRAAASTRRC